MQLSSRPLFDHICRSASHFPFLSRQFRNFFCYSSELKTWNRAINLTAIEQDEEIMVKHFIDSIVGAKVIDSNGEKCVLDIGAGLDSLPCH